MKILYFFSQLQTTTIKNNLLKPQKIIEIRLDRLSMDPHRYWIATGKGMEHPFTGEFHDHYQNGIYCCYHCKNKLFTSEHKYNAFTGIASFFQHFKKSIKIAQTNKKYVFFFNFICNHQFNAKVVNLILDKFLKMVHHQHFQDIPLILVL